MANVSIVQAEEIEKNIIFILEGWSEFWAGRLPLTEFEKFYHAKGVTKVDWLHKEHQVELLPFAETHYSARYQCYIKDDYNDTHDYKTKVIKVAKSKYRELKKQQSLSRHSGSNQSQDVITKVD